MTSPKNTSSERRTATQQEGSDLDTAITELHQTIVRLNKVIEQVKAIPTSTQASDTHPKTMTNASQNKVITLQNLVIPKILH